MGKVVGIDVGGTYTDLFAVDEETGETLVTKVCTTRSAPGRDFTDALKQAGLNGTDVDLIVHGTTVLTNAVIERKGAACGLITTRGFRDILELRRRDRPRQYGLSGSFELLIPRDRRLEVDERADYRGNILRSVSRDEVQAVARSLLDQGVEAIVVSFLHSYSNPSNERAAKEAIEALDSGVHVVLSSEILPEFGEFERTSTAAVNAYVQPLMSRYVDGIVGMLKAKGYLSPLLIVRSNGGMMSAAEASRLPVVTLQSGPGAGVVAASYIAQASGFRNVISCDMGGTSFDVSLISDGEVTITANNAVDFGIPYRMPKIDVISVGAGGGSIGWVDDTGMLRVGPRSAGSEPGPVCYGRGGTEPTVTDANLVLGRINPEHPIGEAQGLRFDVEAAKHAIMEKVGRRIDLDLESAARGMLQVVDSEMARAMRIVSIERGHDPREFVMVAFGGAGPLHVCSLMKEVGVPRGLVPRYPGVACAIGCVLSDVKHDQVQTINKELGAMDEDEIRKVYEAHRAAGEEFIHRQGISTEAISLIFEADMCYYGQVNTIRVSAGNSIPDKSELLARFEAGYRKRYGADQFFKGYGINLVNLRTTVVGARPRLDIKRPEGEGSGDVGRALRSRRPVYFDGGFVSCDIYDRFALPTGAQISGPAIVEQPDTTTVVEPGVVATTDAVGNLILEIE